jgi:DNA-directed RNA polymerase specialized sigma24 family protein
MTCLQDNHKREDNADRYATREDFCRVFREELDGLYQLSFLVTGDHETAERCFLAGLEDCYRANHVFREWALCWAKRTIIRNAIRELRPRLHRDSWSSAEPAFRDSRNPPNIRGSHFKTEALLVLEDLDRVVFVISVLERYSDRDCALLLGCSLPEVRQARTKAILHIVNSGQTSFRQPGEEVAALVGSY